MKAEEIIDLYRKRNRVEHCFRTVNSMDIPFPVYHWIPQKIKVHMLMSMLAYLFLTLIYIEIHKSVNAISLASPVDVLKDIMVVYAARGKTVKGKLDFKSETGKTRGRVMKLDEIVIECEHTVIKQKSLKYLF
ncbi:MAG: hypothetical protein QXP59_04210 [Saccharolobus sp.]